MGSLTHVTINFDTSHLVFPSVIGTVLAVLGLAILITRRQAILGSGRLWRDTFSAMDRFRFFGTLVLTVIYFSLMVPLGDIWPNTGMGFLICSIPFVFLTGLVFLHDRGPRSLWPLLLVALIAPTVVWWLFSYVFFLTLP